ncbi:MAG: signal recognition particle protein, partial [Acidimicrobiales bacterium]|nr:signal recognition particle protein [Acidimicrobiales bacterium]
LTLIEQAEEAFEQEEAEEAARKMMEGQFTLDDFLEQMQQIKKMGSIGSLLSLMPGIPKEIKDVEIEDKQIAHVEAIIRSMTLEERVKPELIDGSRRNRIAAGSGRTPAEVSALIDQFKQMRTMMKQMGGFGTKKRRNKKGKKGKKGGRGGGRTTPKGGAKAVKPELSLPDLEEELKGMPGFDKFEGFPDLP